MTIREALRSAVETLSDEESARVLGYVDAIAQRRGDVNGASRVPATTSDEELVDELTFAEPKAGFAPGSPLWDLVGFIDTDGPTDMAENHDTYLAKAYGDLHEE